MSDTTPREQLAEDIGWLLLQRPHPEMPSLNEAEAAVAGACIAGAMAGLGWRPPAHTVTTWEEVQSLREGALLAIERRGHMWVYERHEDDAWCLSGGGWMDEHWLPATVLYEPEEGE